MARQADVLAALTKASAAVAPLQRVVAELPEGTFEHVRTMADSLPPEPVRRTAAELDEETRKLRQILGEHHRRTRQIIKAGQLAWIRARVRGPRSTCSGARTRASRGRPVRLRGSRRGVVATRAGPEAGDPEPAGFGAPVGDTSQVVALARRRA
jgi:hypothetical protein